MFILKKLSFELVTHAASDCCRLQLQHLMQNPQCVLIVSDMLKYL